MFFILNVFSALEETLRFKPIFTTTAEWKGFGVLLLWLTAGRAPTQICIMVWNCGLLHLVQSQAESLETDRSEETMQTQIRLLLRSSLIRIYTVCHSICIFWMHYCIVKLFYYISNNYVNCSRLSLSRSRRDPLKHFEMICRIEENAKTNIQFHKWTCNLTPLFRDICWKYCGKGEKSLLRSNFSSYPQYFVSWC